MKTIKIKLSKDDPHYVEDKTKKNHQTKKITQKNNKTVTYYDGDKTYIIRKHHLKDVFVVVRLEPIADSYKTRKVIMKIPKSSNNYIDFYNRYKIGKLSTSEEVEIYEEVILENRRRCKQIVKEKNETR